MVKKYYKDRYERREKRKKEREYEWRTSDWGERFEIDPVRAFEELVEWVEHLDETKKDA